MKRSSRRRRRNNPRRDASHPSIGAHRLLPRVYICLQIFTTITVMRIINTRVCVYETKRKRKRKPSQPIRRRRSPLYTKLIPTSRLPLTFHPHTHTPCPLSRSPPRDKPSASPRRPPVAPLRTVARRLSAPWRSKSSPPIRLRLRSVRTTKPSRYAATTTTNANASVSSKTNAHTDRCHAI